METDKTTNLLIQGWVLPPYWRASIKADDASHGQSDAKRIDVQQLLRPRYLQRRRGGGEARREEDFDCSDPSSR